MSWIIKFKSNGIGSLINGHLTSESPYVPLWVDWMFPSELY